MSRSFLVQQPKFVQQLFVAAFKDEGLGGGAQDLQKIVRLPGLEQKAKDLAFVDGADGFFEFGKPGHQQANGLGRVCFDPFEKFNATETRHFLIGEDEVDLAACEMLLRSFGAVRREHVEFRAEKDPQRIEDGWFVIHHEKRTFVPAHLGSHNIGDRP